MKISEAIEEAVLYRLWDGTGEYHHCIAERTKYACLAVELSLLKYPKAYPKVFKAMVEMGMDPERSASGFERFKDGERRQHARIVWLAWVALMFKEGIVP